MSGGGHAVSTYAGDSYDLKANILSASIYNAYAFEHAYIYNAYVFEHAYTYFWKFSLLTYGITHKKEQYKLSQYLK